MSRRRPWLCQANSFAGHVPSVHSRRITDIVRRLSLGRERFSALTLASTIAAGASLLAAVALLRGAAPAGLLALIVVLQVTLIGCTLGAHLAVSRRLAALERLADSDPATGCLNRRGFERALDSALTSALATQNDVALLALDLDYFKRINDRFGHSVGDTVLSEVAATLADTVGAKGIVARLGGEEFSVLLPHADAEFAGEMAERLLARLRTHELPAAHGETITMSIGIAAERVSSRRDSAALRARADEALYMAKRGGRNRVLLWAPGVRSLATPAASMAAITTAPRRVLSS